jgi:UDP-N-acetyl-L-fucosamine synthase
MKKLKVVTVVGTRPEIIRLSRLIPKLDEFTDHILVHTGQNYDPQLSDIFFRDLELRQPDYYLNVDTSSFGSVMGDTLKKSEEIFLKEKPDAVMILGDTNSAVAGIVAERLHIPVYHMEAGNRSFDGNVPEELNRRMIDHVATFNLPYTEHARRNLLAEGIHPRFLLLTGTPIWELYEHHKERIAASQILEELNLTHGGYFLASLHRQENVDNTERLKLALASLSAIHANWGLPILMSTHPRTRERIKDLEVSSLHGITFHQPFGYLDFAKLQISAKCVISDSGTISEESHVMGFPAVTLRDSMERPEALESSSIQILGLKDDPIATVSFALRERSVDKNPDPYPAGPFSDIVTKFVLSTARLAHDWTGVRQL